MEHDPLCTCSDGDCLIICPVGCVCDCRFIAKVRADEREKAAQRVSETFWPTDGSWVSEETTFDAQGRSAVRAARGET